MVVRNILDSRVARKGFSKLEMRGGAVGAREMGWFTIVFLKEEY